MNEAMIKQSILKKTVKMRDSINNTPNSAKSVRFNGVEFMIIGDEDSERSSLSDHNDPFSLDDSARPFEDMFLPFNSKFSTNQSVQSTLPPNKRVNLFRIGDSQNYMNNNNNATTNANNTSSILTHNNNNNNNNSNILDRARSPYQNSNTSSYKTPRDYTAGSRKWSQSFNYKSTGQKPVINNQNSRSLHHRNSTFISRNISGGSSSSSASSLSSNQFQQNRINSASTNASTPTLKSVVSSSTLTANHNNSTFPLTTVQSSPNLTLYSYLLQTNVGNVSNRDSMMNPSLVRSQTKRLTCEEISVKPFVPRVQNQTSSSSLSTSNNNNNNATNTLKTSQSSPSFQQKSSSSFSNTIKHSQSLKKSNSNSIITGTTGAGGIIHVNTRNLGYLTSGVNNRNISGSYDLKNIPEAFMLRFTPAASTALQQDTV